MTDDNAPINRYLEFWNAGTAEEQRAAGRTTFVDDVSYRAPVGLLTGVEALVGFKTDFTEHLGEVQYVARETPESHHARARVRWEIRLADGTSFATGTDVLELNPDGRIAGVSAFLDRAPEGFEHHD